MRGMHGHVPRQRFPYWWLALTGLVLGLSLAACAAGPGAPRAGSGAGPAPIIPATSVAGATTTTSQAVQDQVRALAGTFQVSAAANEIRYTTRAVVLVVVGSPPGRDGEYWQVDGRVNPRVIVPAGAQVTLDVVNGDPDMPHGWMLTTSGPPYSSMPMMSAGIFGGAALSAVVAPLPDAQGNQWPMVTLRFSAPAPGTYYYVCQVPGHAADGMWGTFVVQ